MTTHFRPMLAATAKTVFDIHFPCLASYKLDGVRAIIIEGVAYSRSMKRIPNKYVQSFAALGLYDGFDGELIVGEPNSPDVYNKTVSGVMSVDGIPNFKFHVFDRPFETGGFQERLLKMQTKCIERLQVVPHVCLKTDAELHRLEEQAITCGYEGLIIRSLDAPYKQGRATIREKGMIKLKRFVDSEALVLGVEELLHNENESKTDERGYSTRSTHKENCIAADTMGRLLVRDIHSHVEFKIGTGFSDSERRDIWKTKEWQINKIVKYKYFPVGVKNKPRHPVFLGFRAKEDL